MKKKNKGFSLLELLVSVAIVGILSAIAIPYYGEYVTKSRRVDGQAELISFAQAMERYYTENSTYVGATTAIYSSQSPFYTLSITAQSANDFTLQATAIAGQASDGNLTLKLDGTRGWGSRSCWDC